MKIAVTATGRDLDASVDPRFGRAAYILIVGGIGMRPLMGFRQVGIDVYHDDQRPEIEPVVMDLIAGRLQEITNDQVCGGGGGQ
jgi:predicted Fe-Mo cluster-binding NifX family protein